MGGGVKGGGAGRVDRKTLQQYVTIQLMDGTASQHERCSKGRDRRAAEAGSIIINALQGCD